MWKAASSSHKNLYAVWIAFADFETSVSSSFWDHHQILTDTDCVIADATISVQPAQFIKKAAKAATNTLNISLRLGQLSSISMGLLIHSKRQRQRSDGRCEVSTIEG